MKLIIIPIIAFVWASAAIAQDYEEGIIDIEVRKSYRKECMEITSYSIGKAMKVKCFYNYHHYNTDAHKFYNKSKAIKDKKVKIAEFNLFHPGMNKSRYKDYKTIAQIINQWDVVGITELLPLVSSDLKHNKALIKFITIDAPEKIKKLESELREEVFNLREINHNNGKLKNIIRASRDKIKEIKAQIMSLKSDLIKAPKLYRDPGYIKILKELRKLKNGSQWGLILSPRGEGARKSDVQELIGYFYRGSKVKPKTNKYCKEIRTHGKGTPVACIPNMGKQMLGESKADIFSRRPFIAEFISGNFSFTLLASHVIYNSPKDPEKMANILEKSFGVTDYQQLGKGATASNYARFAEVKVTLEFMDALRRNFNQNDVILLGDLNLESSNSFWENVLSSMPGAQLYVDRKSTISESRFNINGEQTQGLANDMDHFIFDPQQTDECISNGKANVKVESFYEGSIAQLIKQKYEIRLKKSHRGSYTKNTRKYNFLIDQYVTPYKKGRKTVETIGTKEIKVGTKTVRVKGIIKDNNKILRYINSFHLRLLDSQLKDETYYSYFKDLISDHMPISLECATN